MTKNNKILRLPIIMIAIGILVIGIYSLFIITVLNKQVPQSSREREFSRSKEDLQKVAEYMAGLEYTQIYKVDTHALSEMHASMDDIEIGKTVQILDDSIIKSISSLFGKYGYEVITKSKNGIYFQNWSNRHYGRGFVFSTDGKEPQGELLNELEPLSEENWYFYKEK